MHINKQQKNTFFHNSVFSKRIGLTLLSALLLTSCSKTSFPPLFGKSDKKVIVQDPDQYQNDVSIVKDSTPRAIPGQTNNKNLFAKSLRSDNERLSRLERSVQSLRNDFDTVQPSIRRLMAIESDIQELIGELRDLSEQTTRVEPVVVAPVQVAPPPVAQKAVPAKKTTYQRKSSPPIQGGKATIYDVRSGEHPGKSRLVLDSNSNASYTVDIDNNENVMVVDLPNSIWTAAKSKTFPKSSIITSYSVEESDGGNLMIIQLKKNARIGYQAILPSNSGAGKRIVLDVVSQ